MITPPAPSGTLVGVSCSCAAAQTKRLVPGLWGHDANAERDETARITVTSSRSDDGRTSMGSLLERAAPTMAAAAWSCERERPRDWDRGPRARLVTHEPDADDYPLRFRSGATVK